MIETDPFSDPTAPSYGVDPYQDLRQDTRSGYNNHQNQDYIRPLKDQDYIHPLKQKNWADEDYISKRDKAYVDEVVAEREAWNKMKRSPVESMGLNPIETREENNVIDTEELRRAREEELSQSKMPRASPSDLAPISVSTSPGDSDRLLRSYTHDRDSQLTGINFRRMAPPPEAIQCGFSEYQGGSTWEDVNKFREWEERDLRRVMEQQQHQPVRYYY